MEPYGAVSTIPRYGPMIPVVVPMIPFKAWGQEFGLVSVQGIGQNVDLDSGLGCTWQRVQKAGKKERMKYIWIHRASRSPEKTSGGVPLYI
jgi:hypothetical protein